MTTPPDPNEQSAKKCLSCGGECKNDRRSKYCSWSCFIARRRKKNDWEGCVICLGRLGLGYKRIECLTRQSLYRINRILKANGLHGTLHAEVRKKLGKINKAQRQFEAEINRTLRKSKPKPKPKRKQLTYSEKLSRNALNRIRWRINKRKKWRRYRANLSEPYLRHLFSSFLTRDEIPQSILNIIKLRLNLKRTLKDAQL